MYFIWAKEIVVTMLITYIFFDGKHLKKKSKQPIQTLNP